MNVCRLDPSDPGHPSWQYSKEKDAVWTCASTQKEARDLVASKTGFATFAAPGVLSPWQDEKVTSCVWEPTMNYPSAGTVVREDGNRREARRKINGWCHGATSESRVPHLRRRADYEPRTTQNGLPQALRQSPRHHAQAEGAIEDFKKACQPAWTKWSPSTK